MAGPFKLQGHSLPGPNQTSPYKSKYGLSLSTTGASLTSETSKKPEGKFTISPGIRVGDFRAGLSFSKDISKGKISKTSISPRASYTIAPKGKFTTGFKGKLSGEYGKKSGASGKLSLGFEKSGGSYCKGGSQCSDASTEFGLTAGYNLKNKSLSLGGKARRGMFELSGSYNLKSKQKKVTLGIKPFR
jgi:hypothetical protein